MNVKKENAVLIPEFLNDWSDRCDIPYIKIQEIYDALKETWKSYIDAGRPVQLNNFLQLLPSHFQDTITFNDLRSKTRVTMQRQHPIQYKCKLSNYLRYPYEKGTE